MGQDIWFSDVDHISWDYCPICIGIGKRPSASKPGSMSASGYIEDHILPALGGDPTISGDFLHQFPIQEPLRSAAACNSVRT